MSFQEEPSLKPKLAVISSLGWWVAPLLRGVIYLGVFGFLFAGNAGRNDNLIGITSGILYADYLTWVIRKLIWITLDREFAMEGLINVAIAAIAIKVLDISVPTGGDGLAFAFLGFMATAAFKLTFYFFADIPKMHR